MVNHQFTELGKFAQFLLKFHLDTFTTQNISLAREFNLPANKVAFNWPESQYYSFIKWRTEVFLNFFSLPDPLAAAIEELEKWKNDPIEHVKERILNIEDLTNSYRIRKIILTNLLSTYTQDLVLFQQIILEYESFYRGWETEAFKVLFELQNQNLLEKIYIRTRELSRKNEELEKKNSDLDNFIYTASHDLKAPVSNIEGLINSLVDVLTEKGQTDSEINQIIQLINKSVNRFQKTLRDLTEISKVQQNNPVEDIEIIKVSEIIEEVKAIIDYIIRENNAVITFEGNPGYLRFSRNNFRSIIYNLISNAIKYRSPERAPEVRLRLSKFHNTVILKCEDNGMGIKPEYFSKIFQMFKRVHMHVEGTGVGLYLVKRIMENAGGSVFVESEEGRGTTFILNFRELPTDSYFQAQKFAEGK